MMILYVIHHNGLSMNLLLLESVISETVKLEDLTYPGGLENTSWERDICDKIWMMNRG